MLKITIYFKLHRTAYFSKIVQIQHSQAWKLFTLNIKRTLQSVINHTIIFWRRFSFLFTFRWFLVSFCPCKQRWHYTFLQHASLWILRLYEVFIPKMLRTNFSVLVNCELFVISSSYTKNPELPFLWVNRKSMKGKWSIPRITAIGVATWYTAVVTHAENKEKQTKVVTVFCSIVILSWNKSVTNL